METVSTHAATRVKAPRRERLSELDWVKAGLLALAERGVEGLRVDRLARDLGVTKGSFYWHFKNRDELFDALAKFWGETEPDWVIKEVCALPGDARMRLELLGAVYRRERLPECQPTRR